MGNPTINAREETPVIAVSETRGNRSIGLDITRIFAFLSVVAVHSFLNTEFYSNIVSGEKMYVMVIFRTAFMVCVPLFLLLTGYLISTKDVALNSSVILGYYKKLLPLILKYIICMLILYTLSMTFGTEDFNFKSIVFGITGFSKYSWYVNMYIGLFLLTPFLNLIWNSISEKKMHIILVLVFIILTLLPSLFNVYDFSTRGAFLNPQLNKENTALIPDWWVGIYPITYYYIGAYLKKYIDFKKINPIKIAPIFLFSVLLTDAYNIWRSHSVPFVWGTWNEWGGVENTVNSVLIFVLINSLFKSEVNKSFSHFLAYLSSLTFSAYLLSWLSDKIVYSHFNSMIPIITDRFKYYPLAVICSAGMALILSVPIDFAVGFIMKRFKR